MLIQFHGALDPHVKMDEGPPVDDHRDPFILGPDNEG
jgi:hypothetical protein